GAAARGGRRREDRRRVAAQQVGSGRGRAAGEQAVAVARARRQAGELHLPLVLGHAVDGDTRLRTGSVGPAAQAAGRTDGGEGRRYRLIGGEVHRGIVGGAGADHVG